ncbi:MAG: sugar ABC transporter ATP-binding protein [Nitriliruptoraceae bacterium]|nr:sugar ABC transporter ATP-binding protein [Nitriliruptoraceae bacterium]
MSKAFPGVQALDGVDFDLYPGEVHALMGENGAGKSTLMKIIAGVQTADQGALLVRGDAVSFGHPLDAQARGIVTVFQELVVLDNLDVGRNLFLGHEPRRGPLIDWSTLYTQAQAALDDVGVELDVRTPLERLTVGMKQLVEIVRAARLRPDVLILDEPTSALGRREETLLFELIARLRARGVAIVYISHRMDEVFRLADRITVLRDGRHVLTDDAAALDRPRLIASMVGREVVDGRIVSAQDSPGDVELEVRDLHRAPRVHGVSFSLSRGEVLGVAGLVGAGRTELAEVLYGAARADRGRIELAGEVIAPRSPRQAMSLGIGYVPEDRKADGIVAGMSVEENVALPGLRSLTVMGLLRWAKLRSLAQHWVAQLRIKVSSPRQTVGTLSGGNQQKVVISKVLSRDPRVLILDEPTRGIDVGSKRELHELIRRVADDGVAVLLISSELPELLAVADRIMVMRGGELVGVIDGAQATEQAIIDLAFSPKADG